MAGLVADYDSDDSSDSENIDEELPEEANREDQKGTNYLEGASSSSSDSEDNVALPDDSKSTTEWRQKLPSPNLLNVQSRNPGRRTLSQASKLPNPLLGGQARPTHSRTSAGQSASIFHNPYKTAEREKEKVLEKHVKLTPNKHEKPSHIAGKKVCWNFRKGRCRFGHKCKYAHDSDLPISPQPTDAPTGAVASSAGYFDQPEVLNDEEDPDNPVQQRKKRPGLSQTLQPPKKSIKAYQKQLAVERPWMAQK